MGVRFRMTDWSQSPNDGQRVTFQTKDESGARISAREREGERKCKCDHECGREHEFRWTLERV